jgi:hypothetical protein
VEDRDGAEEDWTPTSPRKAGRGGAWSTDQRLTNVVVLWLPLTS